MIDIIGRRLAIGDPVAFRFPRSNELRTGRIIAFTKVMARIEWSEGRWRRTHLARSEDIVLLPNDEYVFYVMQHP